MKKFLLGLSLILFVFTANAQSEGLKFLTDMTLEQAQAYATKNEKILLVDVYATWCGPCKKLAKDVFPNKIVGDALNESFVAIKFDAEAGQGIEIAKKYRVKAYPTLILFSDGKELLRMEGAPSDPQEFVDYVLAKVLEAE
ncbi:MAG: thioredoxin family protein [Mucinivorans sp.]